jgi:hypothetical protein
VVPKIFEGEIAGKSFKRVLKRGHLLSLFVIGE